MKGASDNLPEPIDRLKTSDSFHWIPIATSFLCFSNKITYRLIMTGHLARSYQGDPTTSVKASPVVKRRTTRRNKRHQLAYLLCEEAKFSIQTGEKSLLYFNREFPLSFASFYLERRLYVCGGVRHSTQQSFMLSKLFSFT